MFFNYNILLCLCLLIIVRNFIANFCLSCGELGFQFYDLNVQYFLVILFALELGWFRAFGYSVTDGSQINQGRVIVYS